MVAKGFKKQSKMPTTPEEYFEKYRLTIPTTFLIENRNTGKESKKKGWIVMDSLTGIEDWFVPVEIYPGGASYALVDRAMMTYSSPK